MGEVGIIRGGVEGTWFDSKTAEIIVVSALVYKFPHYTAPSGKWQLFYLVMIVRVQVGDKL